MRASFTWLRFTLIPVFVAALAACSSQVDSSATGGDTSAEGQGTGGGAPTSGTTSPTGANPAGGESPTGGGCQGDGDQQYLCMQFDGVAYVTRWGDVPQGGTTGSTSGAGGGGGVSPDDLLVVISPSEGVTCATPFGPDGCADYQLVSFTVHPEDWKLGAQVDLAAVGAVASMETSQCEGGGGTVGGTATYDINPDGKSFVLLDVTGASTVPSGVFAIASCGD